MRTFTVEDGGTGADVPHRADARRHGSGSRCVRQGRRTDRPRSEVRVRRVSRSTTNNTYTFLSVYLPWANGDGMEHRNSTSLTGQGALRNPAQRQGILGTVSHEFFHCWNMERIRSKGIEPFDFEEADVSEDLWLGEGFTNYYDGLIMERAGRAGARRVPGRPRRHHQSDDARAGPQDSQRGRDEPAGAVRRRRRRRSIARRRRTRSSRTTPMARRSRSGSTSRCATRTDKRHARHLHAGAVGELSASPGQKARRASWPRRTRATA